MYPTDHDKCQVALFFVFNKRVVKRPGSTLLRAYERGPAGLAWSEIVLSWFSIGFEFHDFRHSLHHLPRIEINGNLRALEPYLKGSFI